ncbi:hypothetical protein CR513_34711, partial [Mucuna pruriens]
MGMNYKKIHAYPNDFILHKKQFEATHQCPKYGESRYKKKDGDCSGNRRVLMSHSRERRARGKSNTKCIERSIQGALEIGSEFQSALVMAKHQGFRPQECVGYTERSPLTASSFPNPGPVPLRSRETPY